MRKVIDKFNETLANNEIFNTAFTFVAIAIHGLSTIAIFCASYFRGMRRGVDITDAYYDKG